MSCVFLAFLVFALFLSLDSDIFLCLCDAVLFSLGLSAFPPLLFSPPPSPSPFASLRPSSVLSLFLISPHRLFPVVSFLSFSPSFSCCSGFFSSCFLFVFCLRRLFSVGPSCWRPIPYLLSQLSLSLLSFFSLIDSFICLLLSGFLLVRFVPSR